MSATELDVPVLIAADQIRRREFVTTRRGYDPDQVRDYLETLADQVDLMASMIREARLEAEATMRADVEPRVDPYEQLARRVTSVIREADDAAERFRIEGRRDAERLMTEARADAERIRTETQAAADQARRQAERALHDAREQADRTIAGLSSRRDALVGQLAQMQERLLGVAADLEATIVAPGIVVPPDIVEPTGFEPPSAPTSGPSASSNGAGPIAPNGAPAPPNVIDVRGGDLATPPPRSIEELFADLDASGRDDPWNGTDAMHLEVPDIPPLDLDWGDASDDDLT